MMKKQQGSTHFYFPNEIWTQIMCFLPVRSLLLFRIVCKSFQSIIDDPDFASLHLRIFPDNLNQTLTLVHTHERVKETVKNNYEIRESSGFALRAKLDFPDWQHFNPLRQIICSLDGLFLLDSTLRREVATLWNPSTRQIRRIPPPNNYYLYYTSKILTGLAYDSSSRDYKVLYITRRPWKVWVYSVKTSSWTTVSIEDSGMCTLPFWDICHTRPLFFEGALLWIETYYLDDQDWELRHRMVRFEVGTLKIQYYTDLPALATDRGALINNRLVMHDGGSRLGLCGLDGANRAASIWDVSLDGDACLWAKRYVIPQVLSLRDGRTSVWVSKNEELRSMYRKGTSGTITVWTYNLRTHHCHESEITPSYSTILHPGSQHAYVQSLIRL